MCMGLKDAARYVQGSKFQLQVDQVKHHGCGEDG